MFSCLSSSSSRSLITRGSLFRHSFLFQSKPSQFACLVVLRNFCASKVQLNSRNNQPIQHPFSSSSRKPVSLKRVATFAGFAVTAGALAYIFISPSSSKKMSTDAKQPHVGGVGYNPAQIDEILKLHEQTILNPLGSYDKNEAEANKSAKNSVAGVLKMFGFGEKMWWEQIDPAPVVRIDKNEVASNDPCEDGRSENRFGGTLLIGVYDGHGGPACSKALSYYLTHYIANSLSIVPPASTSNKATRRLAIEKALKSAFTRLDSDLLSGRINLPEPDIEPPPDVVSVSTSEELTDRQKWIAKKLSPAMNGSCAIVAYIEGNEIFVACTGDCRAVIGRRRSGSSDLGADWEAIELSVDQTLRNPKEYARILEEHPGENETVIARGRILGSLMPTRAFGDAKYKYPIHTLHSLAPLNPRRVKPYRYLTPPYVTAEPVVTHHTLDLARDLFLIVACDGLWDELSSEESIELVGGFMERQNMVPAPSYIASKQKSPSSDIQTEYVFKDSNAATHLIRNAFGGNDESVGKLLAIPSPYSRKYRDDVSVSVVFFSGANVDSANVASKSVSDGVDEVDLRRADLKKERLTGWCAELDRTNNLKAKL